MRRWKVLKSTELLKARLFRLRTDQCELPDKRVMPSYYVMEFPDWVNIVPVTTDKQMILIEQYRHAGGETYIEVPGGATHGPDEDPQDAGARELLEETGYESSEWIYCGYHSPNPALQDNKLHTYLALNCRQVSAPQLDPFEDLTVKLMPVKDALALWSEGGMKHSLISASIALSLRFLKQKGVV